MKLSEFSNVYKVSERHVRRLIKKYESDMVGHYEQRGNEGTFIDDVGVDILKSKLTAQFDVVVAEPSEEEKQLNEQLILALAKCTTLAEQLADAERRAGQNAAAGALLEATKANVAQLEAQASEAEGRAAQAEAERKQAVETLEVMRREAQFRAEAAYEAEEQRIEAEKRTQAAEERAAELQALLDQIAGARGMKRRKLLKELRKNKS